MRETRRPRAAGSCGLAGGVALLARCRSSTLRPAEATPATLAPRSAMWSARRRCSTGKVKLDMPPLVENGNTVPMTVSVDSPMTADDYVKSIHVFNEKNPQPNVGNFYLGPRAGRAQVSTRIRLADSQKIVAIAEISRRLVLVGQRRRRGDAGRLHRGGDLMASALINVPTKAKRGDIIEIKTLMSHIMETGYPPHRRRRRRPARHHHELLLPLQWRGDFPRRSVPGDRGQPVHHFFTIATESGTLEFDWIGDNGFSATAIGHDHGRMRCAARHSRWRRC